MANTIGFGQAAVNNTIGFGQGALTGSTPFSNTKSIELDGIDDYVDLGDLSTLSGATEFSVSLWFYATTTANKVMFDLKDGSSRIAIQRRDQNKIYLYINGVSGLFTVSTLNSNWYNLSYIFNGSGATDSDKLKLYINGIEVNATSYSSTVPTSLGVLTSSMSSVIGGAYNGTYTFLGNIDEVAVWNTDQSANASAIGSTIPTDLSIYSPLSWWRFEGTGLTATDSGSGGNDGTLENGVIRSTDVPT